MGEEDYDPLVGLVVVVMSECTDAVFRGPIVFDVIVRRFQVAQFLPCRDDEDGIFEDVLPGSVNFVVPCDASYLASRPAVKNVVLLCAVLIVVVMSVIGFVLVGEGSSKDVPYGVPVLGVYEVRDSFGTLILCFARVNRSKARAEGAQRALTRCRIYYFLRVVVRIDDGSSVRG